jgi:hypothetical protein
MAIQILKYSIVHIVADLYPHKCNKQLKGKVVTGKGKVNIFSVSN